MSDQNHSVVSPQPQIPAPPADTLGPPSASPALPRVTRLCRSHGRMSAASRFTLYSLLRSVFRPVVDGISAGLVNIGPADLG
jgi:hypothetical protein